MAATPNATVPWRRGEPHTIESGVDSLLQLASIPVSGRPDVSFLDDTPALATPLQIGRASASCLAAFGSLLAEIWQRRRGTRLARLRVDVKHAELSTMGVFMSRVNGRGLIRSMYLDPRVLRLHRKMGIPLGMPATPVNRTADDRWFLIHQSYGARSLGRAPDCKFSPSAIKRAVAFADADELEERVAKCGGVGTVFRTPTEWAQHPQGRELTRRPVIEVEKLRDGLPLLDCNFSPPDGLARPDEPLSGLRVLDLTRVVAGPACTRLLAEYGAECLKISAPHLPYWEFLSRIENAGKRNAHIDLRDVEQRRHFLERVDDADILFSSYRAGAFSKFGVGPEDLAARSRRGIVVVSVSCYGSGPWESRGGYDQLAQMATGYAALHMQHSSKHRPGLEQDEAPRLVPKTAANDYSTAQLGALGALVGLLRRADEGGSYHVKVSLAQSAMWIQEFGVRTSVPHYRIGVKRILPEVLDGPSRKHVAPYLATLWSDFGPIERFKSALGFPDSSLAARLRNPSVHPGTHLPEW